MSVPRRWIDDGGGSTSTERDLLRSALSVEPPPGAQGEVWAALLAKLPPPGGGAGGHAGAAGKAAAGAKAAGAVAVGGGIVKASLIGAGAAIVLIAGYMGGSALRSGSQAAQNPGPAVAVSPTHPQAASVTISPTHPQAAPNPGPAPIVAAPVPQAAPAAAAPVSPSLPQAAPNHGLAEPAQRPAPVSPAEPALNGAHPDPGAERETMLQEESREMRDAREALRRGDAAGALTMLEQIRARYPGGVLSQEREALAIEALARSGRRAEASTRAAAFLKAYPTSTLAERVQVFVQP